MRLQRLGGRVNVTLETEKDRILERYVMERIVKHLGPPHQALRMPKYSIVDYAISNGDAVTSQFELKVRKESMTQVRSYGGLMLKHRKIADMQKIAELTRIPTIILFAFDQGKGELLFTQPHQIIDLPPEDPPRRRNYRGLATDEEPVVYIDWDLHLKAVPAPL
jgi:hypothetical protein